MLATTSQDFSIIGGVVLPIVFLFLYFLPALVANHRGRESQGMIWLVNILLGWTVLAWIVLLVVAFTGESKTERLRREEQNALLRRIADNGGTPPPL